jgi:hypothetical protein
MDGHQRCSWDGDCSRHRGAGTEEANVTTKADRLAQPLQRAPLPEAATPGMRAAQAGPSEAKPAQVLVAQAATRAMRRSMTYESGMAKMAKTVVARSCRTEEGGGACLPLQSPQQLHFFAPPPGPFCYNDKPKMTKSW